jgi:hypothetical protein
MPPRVHLHRVVPSARPHGVGTPPRDDWILPGRRGSQPIRVARRPGPLAQATRAAWIYIAMLTPPASLPAPRRCFSPSAPHGWPSIGALADRRCPATASICVAIRVEAARTGSYSGYLDLVASLEAWNGKADQRRITGLTLPLDAGRRLIQRLVLQNVLAGRTTYLRPDASNIFRHSSFGCDSACESTIAKGYRVIV